MKSLKKDRCTWMQIRQLIKSRLKTCQSHKISRFDFIAEKRVIQRMIAKLKNKTKQTTLIRHAVNPNLENQTDDYAEQYIVAGTEHGRWNEIWSAGESEQVKPLWD